MSVKPALDIKSLAAKLAGIGQRLLPYRLPAFLLFVALLYVFLLLHISSLSNTQPSESTVSSQVKAARLPRIDQSVIKQLQSLQDNSVSVRSLFNQARNNPFQ
jgi:hypothetical protein